MIILLIINGATADYPAQSAVAQRAGRCAVANSAGHFFLGRDHRLTAAQRSAVHTLTALAAFAACAALPAARSAVAEPTAIRRPFSATTPIGQDAHIEATGAEKTPIHPPNTTAPNESTNPSQSIRRESTRLRTPSTQPGFVPTQTILAGPHFECSSSSTRSRSDHGSVCGTKASRSSYWEHVAVDMAQDSEDENYKARKVGSKKTHSKTRMGSIIVGFTFFLRGKGQIRLLKMPPGPADGARRKQLRGACLGREKAIAAGGSSTLPEQRAQVVREIKASDSKISLVSDVWTTKGSHKAFLVSQSATSRPTGITVPTSGNQICLVASQWKVPCGSLCQPQTTDSGSNNFTMAKGVAAIFRNIDATYWDVQKQHHRALKLSSSMVRPEKDDNQLNVTDEQEVDPDDAEPALPQPGWEWNTGEDEDVHFDESGIGFTLKKIDYICHRMLHHPEASRVEALG
ncbi:hypothetical protein KEM48_004591 [Puccinia striiformis f. sp. tritici PST-130]|nr:hypothetical protein KEM48_004591 [Puccinia striiformis f. sp. tritici PST-130]